MDATSVNGSFANGDSQFMLSLVPSVPAFIELGINLLVENLRLQPSASSSRSAAIWPGCSQMFQLSFIVKIELADRG
jgi:hypothetical protein